MASCDRVRADVDAVNQPEGRSRRALELARQDGLGAFAALVPSPAAPCEGPLHGVPVAVKDMIDTADLPTCCGSRHFRGRQPATNASCVQRLVDAGAVLLGKTTTHEFAYGPSGDSFDGGPAHNPWDPDRIPGGSSCGSAIAVSTGVVRLALGTDTGGSCRIPAALCGTLGLKPTTGLIPTDGVAPLSTSLDTVGILASDTDLLTTAWEVLTGRTAGRFEGLPSVGMAPRAILGPMDDEVWNAAQDAVSAIWPESSVVAGFPSTTEFSSVYPMIVGPEAYCWHRQRMETRPELYQPDVREQLTRAGAVAGWQYVAALNESRRLRGECLHVFEQCDVLALPTVPMTAPRIGQTTITLEGEEQPVRGSLLRLTQPFSVLGWPALSIPVARSTSGLPIGLQLVAPPERDDVLLGLAARAFDPGVVQMPSRS